MANVLLVIHIVVAVTMVVIILLQRSEGGALGMGGGGGGGFVSGRGVANIMTRTTAILAAIFFFTSITLGILGQRKAPTSAIGTPTSTTAPSTAPAPAQNAPEPALPQLKIPTKPAAPAQ